MRTAADMVDMTLTIDVEVVYILRSRVTAYCLISAETVNTT